MRSICLFFTVALVAACAQTTEGEAALNVTDDKVVAGNGRVLITIDEVPGRVAVTADSQFGASAQLVGASLAPDKTWLAVVSSGAAHGAVWLVPYIGGSPIPVAFQYGGDVMLGPWSDNGRYLAVRHLSPAGDCTLAVIDRETLGATVEANTIPVKVPGHDETRPSQRCYSEPEWQSGQLEFTLNGQRWRFDPSTASVLFTFRLKPTASRLH